MSALALMPLYLDFWWCAVDVWWCAVWCAVIAMCGDVRWCAVFRHSLSKAHLHGLSGTVEYCVNKIHKKTRVTCKKTINIDMMSLLLLFLKWPQCARFHTRWFQTLVHPRCDPLWESQKLAEQLFFWFCGIMLTRRYETEKVCLEFLAEAGTCEMRC